MNTMPLSIRRALISVSDKDGLLPLVKILQKFSVEIISTGGTGKLLTENKIDFTPIERITGNPESFGGRMKTLSFQIGSALLYRRGHVQDEKEASILGIKPIDLVVVNLYPFEKVYAAQGSEEELIENIDIGGPTMLRAAAKNFESVTICSSPEQYQKLQEELEHNQGKISFETRKDFAGEVFATTARYDGLIAQSFSKENFTPVFKQSLRYGENPHQSAKLFTINNRKTPGIAQAKILQGKELSYNNFLDADAAWKVTCDVTGINPKKCTAVVVKHLNPCGVAMSASPLEALQTAWDCDSVSAFGGILSFSFPVNEQIAHFFTDKFVEIIVAPEFSSEALKILSEKKSLRLLQLPLSSKNSQEKVIRSISGGLLIQDEDEKNQEEFRLVSKKKFPSEKEQLAQFGIQVNKHLKSNAISLVAQNTQGNFYLAGAGMGQPNRLDSLSRLAVPRALEKKENLSEVVLISDAFFPFADSIEVAHNHGIKYIVQPGGSIRDPEVIAACDKYEMAMVFTGTRHFRH